MKIHDIINEKKEIVSLNDVLLSDQYIRILKNLKVRADKGQDVQKIKNQILRSWKKGRQTRKHLNSLLKKVDLSLDDLIDN